MSLLRTVGALLVGLVFILGAVLFCSLRAYRFEGMLIGVLMAVAGGYTAALVAGRRPVLHAGLLAGILVLPVLLGILNLPAGMVFTALGFFALPAGAVLLGGWLRSREVHGTEGTGTLSALANGHGTYDGPGRDRA